MLYPGSRKISRNNAHHELTTKSLHYLKPKSHSSRSIKRHSVGHLKCQRPASSCKNCEKLQFIWNKEDFEIFNNMVEKCNLMDDKLQKKMNYFYKPYGKFSTCQPALPINYDSAHVNGWTAFNQEASMKWGSLAKAILNQDHQYSRALIQSVNGEAYTKLKEFADQIQKPKFQKLFTYLNNFPNAASKLEVLKYAQDGMNQLNNLIDFTAVGEKKQVALNSEMTTHDLITSLLLIKRSKLEKLIKALSKRHIRYNSTSRRRSKFARTECSSRSDMEKLSVLNPRTDRYFINSSKVVPLLPSILPNAKNEVESTLSSNRKIQKYRKLSQIHKSPSDSTNISLHSIKEETVKRVDISKETGSDHEDCICIEKLTPTKPVPLVRLGPVKTPPMLPKSSSKQLSSIESVESCKEIYSGRRGSKVIPKEKIRYLESSSKHQGHTWAKCQSCV